MPAHARSHIVDELNVGVYHCVNRCVRRAFLCGQDTASGRNFDHRKLWIRQRLETLAGLFAIDILGFAVMANHLHLVLRNRPDVAADWSDEEVSRRWCELFPRRCPAAAGDAAQTAAAMQMLREQMLLADPERLAECRRRLSSLSWLMRCLCEPIARAGNREDCVTGRFWEGRFKCQALLDEAAVLACSLYVDLNPIRAGLADTPETSFFTSACERIADRRADVGAAPVSGWLAPIPTADVPGQIASFETTPADTAPARRASHRGFLPLSLDDYLRLLDWTGRQFRAGCRGRIPARLQPIFRRLRLNADSWIACVLWFGRQFHRAVGRAASMEQFADRAGQRWMQGVRHSRQAFG